MTRHIFGAACLSLAILAGLSAAMVSVAVANDADASGCSAPSCLRAGQSIRWYEAWRVKRELQRQALLLDIRSGTRPGSGSLIPRFDAHVAFVEFDGGAIGPGAMRFHAGFPDRVDDIVREVGLRESDPIMVLCDTPYCGELAAVLLQERGYSHVHAIVR